MFSDEHAIDLFTLFEILGLVTIIEILGLDTIIEILGLVTIIEILGLDTPPEIGKNIIFLRKTVIFHTKYPNNFPASLLSAPLF